MNLKMVQVADDSQAALTMDVQAKHCQPALFVCCNDPSRHTCILSIHVSIDHVCLELLLQGEACAPHAWCELVCVH